MEQPQSLKNTISKYFHYMRVHNTVMEMLDDRGYVISEEELATVNENEYEDVYQFRKQQEKKFGSIWEAMSTVYEKKDGTNMIYVRYLDPIKESNEIGGIVIDKLIEEIRDIKEMYANLQEIILIVPQKISSNSMSKLQYFRTPESNLMINIFLDKELMFNITKHMLVPKHILLSPHERKELVLELNKKAPTNALKTLPKIYDTDPISKYYGAKVGQVFKIIRESLFDDVVAKKSVFYRVVVKYPVTK
jgi:DNA-directed RNA polymerase I, II, and III subunit RPABC1